LRDYYREVLSIYGYGKGRPFISEVIDVLDEKWDSKYLFIVEAPTGYGKSTITATLALKTYKEDGKLIIALPLRTLLEDQFNKLRKIVDDERVIGKRYMHEHDSPYLIKPITVTTVDTLAMTMFGIAPEDLSKVARRWDDWTGTITGSMGHYLFSWSSVALSDIILDEAHLLTDTTKSLTYLATLIEYMIKNDQKTVLMSATLSKTLKGAISKNLLKYKNKIEWIEFGEKDGEFISERMEKRYEIKLESLNQANKFAKILSWIEEGKENNLNRALVIFNTVADAIEFYKQVEDDNKLLLHSRFSTKEKEEKHKILNSLRNQERYIIVGTQTIEAGIDISSDLLITEVAPASSLIQRFGRFLRYYGEKDGTAYIWYEEPMVKKQNEDKYKVYDASLCASTLEYIEHNVGRINMHIPHGEVGYKKLIDTVYESCDITVDRNKVDDMLLTFVNLGDISHAVELMFKEEGSFIRESISIPVQVDAQQEEPIPIDHSLFNRLLRQNKVAGFICHDGKKVEEIASDIKEKLNDTHFLLKFMFRRNVKAFIIEGMYDRELGLLSDGIWQ